MATNPILIYKFTSPSGKSYIGQTCDLKARINKHKTNNSCVAFATAIKKYGFENFTKEILEENLTTEEANIKEEYYIAELNTLSPNGYNLQSGGKSRRCSEYTKNKLSILNSGKNHPQYGKKISETRRIELSKSKKGENNPMYGKYGELHHNYGKKLSEETKEKLRENHADFTGDKNPMYGKQLSEETKEKIKKAHAKKWIIIFPDGNNEVVENLKEFCRNNKLNAACMVKVAQGQRKQHNAFKCSYYIPEANI